VLRREDVPLAGRRAFSAAAKKRRRRDPWTGLRGRLLRRMFAKATESIPVTIIVRGYVGVGKTSFCNAFMGLKENDCTNSGCYHLLRPPKKPAAVSQHVVWPPPASDGGGGDRDRGSAKGEKGRARKKDADKGKEREIPSPGRMRIADGPRTGVWGGGRFGGGPAGYGSCSRALAATAAPRYSTYKKVVKLSSLWDYLPEGVRRALRAKKDSALINITLIDTSGFDVKLTMSLPPQMLRGIDAVLLLVSVCRTDVVAGARGESLGVDGASWASRGLAQLLHTVAHERLRFDCPPSKIFCSIVGTKFDLALSEHDEALAAAPAAPPLSSRARSDGSNGRAPPRSPFASPQVASPQAKGSEGRIPRPATPPGGSPKTSPETSPKPSPKGLDGGGRGSACGLTPIESAMFDRWEGGEGGTGTGRAEYARLLAECGNMACRMRLAESGVVRIGDTLAPVGGVKARREKERFRLVSSVTGCNVNAVVYGLVARVLEGSVVLSEGALPGVSITPAGSEGDDGETAATSLLEPDGLEGGFVYVVTPGSSPRSGGRTSGHAIELTADVDGSPRPILSRVKVSGSSFAVSAPLPSREKSDSHLFLSPEEGSCCT
jgi:hypothetical protein